MADWCGEPYEADAPPKGRRLGIFHQLPLGRFLGLVVGQRAEEVDHVRQRVVRSEVALDTHGLFHGVRSVERGA